MESDDDTGATDILPRNDNGGSRPRRSNKLFLLVSWVNVNAKSIVCFGFGRCQGNQPERRQTEKKTSFHLVFLT